MKFIHLSDLHILGKRVNEFSMINDQAILEQMLI